MAPNGKKASSGDCGAEAGGSSELATWRFVRRKLSELKLPPDVMREDLGDIDSLTESLKAHGLLLPILIEPDGTVRGGRRRMLALKQIEGEGREGPGQAPAAGEAEGKPDAGRATGRTGRRGSRRRRVDCVILPPGVDPTVAQIVENIHRKNLTPLEEAQAYRLLLDRTGWTQRRLARELAVSPSHVSLTLNLLKAPRDVIAKLKSGEVSAHAVKSAFGKRAAKLAARPAEADGDEVDEGADAVEPPSPRPGSRAANVVDRAGGGGRRVVRTSFTEPCIRLTRRELHPRMRARVFLDRVEVTFVIRDATEDLRNLKSVAETVRKMLARLDWDIVDRLRRARRRLLGTDLPESEAPGRRRG